MAPDNWARSPHHVPPATAAPRSRYDLNVHVLRQSRALKSFSARLPRPARLVTKVSGVLAAQLVVQLLGVLAGFALLRWLNVRNYAQYSLAFGFTSTLAVLVDLGIPGSLAALVGDRRDDPQIIGGYIRVARRFRNRIMAVAVPVGAVVFFVLTARQHWGWPTQLGLYASISGTLYVRSNVDFFTSALVIHGRYTTYYLTQVIVALARLIVQGGLYVIAALTSLTAMLLTAAASAVTGFVYRTKAQPYVQQSHTPGRSPGDDMRRLIGPQLPACSSSRFRARSPS